MRKAFSYTIRIDVRFLAMSGSKRHNRAASAQGQEADIAVLALDPHSWGVRQSLVFSTGRGVYGNHIFSVYPGRRRSRVGREVFRAARRTT